MAFSASASQSAKQGRPAGTSQQESLKAIVEFQNLIHFLISFTILKAQKMNFRRPHFSIILNQSRTQCTGRLQLRVTINLCQSLYIRHKQYTEFYSESAKHNTIYIRRIYKRYGCVEVRILLYLPCRAKLMALESRSKALKKTC